LTPKEFPISTILQIGKLSQTLSNISNQKNILFKGGVIDQRLPITIYQVWKPLSLRYAANPSDTTVRQVAEYLLSLCGSYALQAQQIINNLAGSLPVIIGPSNQSVVIGNNAVFSITVTSSSPVTYAWYQNGILVPGATGPSYTVVNAQISQNGNTYFATATNTAGTTISNQATLTVTAALVAFYYYGTTDYSGQLNAGIDSVPYVGTFPYTPGQPLSFQWPLAAANSQFIVVKYPATESTKVNYANGALNNGAIPSVAFEPVKVITTWKYIYSRTGNAFSQDTTTPLVFS
jgi:hypothetical protein